MGQLRTHEHSDEGMCEECKVRRSVGPCASCHGMVCGDCCTMTTDPAGKSVMCLSCARLLAKVSKAPLVRRSSHSKNTALMIIGVLVLGILAAVLRQ